MFLDCGSWVKENTFLWVSVIWFVTSSFCNICLTQTSIVRAPANTLKILKVLLKLKSRISTCNLNDFFQKGSSIINLTWNSFVGHSKSFNGSDLRHCNTGVFVSMLLSKANKMYFIASWLLLFGLGWDACNFSFGVVKIHISSYSQKTKKILLSCFSFLPMLNAV